MEEPKIESKFKLVKMPPKADFAITRKQSYLWQGICAVLIVLLALSIWTGGFGLKLSDITGGTVVEQPEQQIQQTAPQTIGVLGTFGEVSGDVFKEDGKPVIMLFSTTWCPHCTWVKDTFDKVASEYIAQGKINAYHWQIDTGDNTLTTEVETKVPDEYMQIYQTFNPGGSIPTFVFGGKYFRIGTGYERENDLVKEEAEFRQIIDKLFAA